MRVMEVDEKRLEDAEPYGRRIQLLIAKGHYAAAMRTLSEAEMEMERNHTPPLMDCALADVGMPAIMLNFLEAHFGAVMIGDMEAVETRALLEIPGAGHAG